MRRSIQMWHPNVTPSAHGNIQRSTEMAVLHTTEMAVLHTTEMAYGCIAYQNQHRTKHGNGCIALHNPTRAASVEYIDISCMCTSACTAPRCSRSALLRLPPSRHMCRSLMLTATRTNVLPEEAHDAVRSSLFPEDRGLGLDCVGEAEARFEELARVAVELFVIIV